MIAHTSPPAKIPNLVQLIAQCHFLHKTKSHFPRNIFSLRIATPVLLLAQDFISSGNDPSVICIDAGNRYFGIFMLTEMLGSRLIRSYHCAFLLFTAHPPYALYIHPSSKNGRDQCCQRYDRHDHDKKYKNRA